MKIPAHPPIGHLIAYEYLWHSQSDEIENALKTYPAALVLAEDRGGVTIAYALGISHSEPREGQRALEIPIKLKRHLGLDTDPAWIYTDEINVFAWPGPDLRPADRLSKLPQARDTCVIGRLPDDWFATVKAHLAESRKLGLTRAVPRRT